LANRLRELLFCERFCNYRANSNRPGVLLSGGLDSSLITALLRKHRDDVHTYAVGFKDEPDEREDAQLVARHFGTTHRTIVIAPENVEALLWDTVCALGFPTGNPSALATYLVAKNARGEVDRLVSGLGSDEVFAGHTKHVAARYWPFARSLAALAKKISPLRPGKNNSTCWNADGIKDYIDLYTYFSDPELNQLLLNRERLNPAKVYADFRKMDFNQSIFLTDIFVWLSDGLLPLAATLAANQNLSFETPFCSDPMLEFAAKVPFPMKVRGFTGKWILRKAAADILPGSIFKKKRNGFSLPMGKWLKGPLRHLLTVYLSEKVVSGRGIFRPDTIETMIQSHLQGKNDYSLQLWALITLEVWQQIFLDQN
jgi:asparagine synthase (glutamine-hydrolysing)